jgi:23S rRNA pseudouridine955/2504/2580 synthase
MSGDQTQGQAVTADEADIRLDRWFRRHFPAATQGVIQKLCRTGQIRVDGKRVEAASRLAAGQHVRVPPQAVSMAPPPKPVVASLDPATVTLLRDAVIYKDEYLIVLNKPYGLPVQGGPGITRHLDGMLDALRFGADKPRLVHRLDRDTTGVLVLARTAGTAARLAASFKGRDVQKTYWAVVAGRPLPVEGRIDLPLRRGFGPRGERTEVADRDGKDGNWAVTDYQTLDNAAQKLAWLELSPLSGRTHQLRVHCWALGAPILGDGKYETPDQNGAGSAYVEGLSDNLHLHARALRLPHPEAGTLTIEADLPPHMRETFRILGFAAAPAAKPERLTGRDAGR